MKVIELLSSPNRWIKHNSALDDQGWPVEVGGARATKWCLIGALAHCYHRDVYSSEQYNNARDAVEWAIMKLYPIRFPHGFILGFNDHWSTTYEDVVAVLKEADV